MHHSRVDCLIMFSLCSIPASIRPDQLRLEGWRDLFIDEPAYAKARLLGIVIEDNLKRGSRRVAVPTVNETEVHRWQPCSLQSLHYIYRESIETMNTLQPGRRKMFGPNIGPSETLYSRAIPVIDDPRLLLVVPTLIDGVDFPFYPVFYEGSSHA